MRFNLKGDFNQQVEQVKFLKNNNIDVNMNDGKFHFDCDNGSELLKLLSLVKNNSLFNETVKEITSKFGKISNDYNKNINSYAALEDYTLICDENTIEVKNTARSFKIIKQPREDFNAYHFEFKDSGIDFNYLDNREIIYLIQKNNKMYEAFKALADNLDGNVITDAKVDGKVIYLKEDENGINLIFNKKVVDGIDNSLMIGTPFDNDKWLLIDKLYDDLSNKIKRR